MKKPHGKNAPTGTRFFHTLQNRSAMGKVAGLGAANPPKVRGSRVETAARWPP